MTGELYFPEMTGGGGGFLDYDGDGDLDVYLVQGHLLGHGKTVDDALIPPAPGETFRDRLYRNDLVVHPDGRRELRFVDVTEQAELDASGYGMGMATGDYDNDGDMDIYLTNLGPNQLWRNDGDGTFTDVTAAAGVDDDRWSVAAAFFDIDRDGDQDLYVGNYVDFSLSSHKVCVTESGVPDYCGPLAFQPVADRLLRNDGDGTFTNVTRRAGMGLAGSTLGAIPSDFNDDGWMDLYVANDQMPNQLWFGLGKGRFEDEALMAGAAVNRHGQAEASMGVDAADFDNDGDEDLFMAHLARETNTLYRNDGTGMFHDASLETGLGAPSWDYTGFGTAFFDYDLDGHLDLVVVNGAVRKREAQVRAGDVYPMKQPNQLYRNLGGGQFEEVTALAGEVFELMEVSRGAAVGDVDNDGAPDVLVINNSGPVRLLRNQTAASDAGWLGLNLVNAQGSPRLGARAAVLRSGKTPLVRRVRSAGSYVSAHSPRVLFGLGIGDGTETPATTVDVEVHWPDAVDGAPAVELFRGIQTGEYVTLVQGTGTPERDETAVPDS